VGSIQASLRTIEVIMAAVDSVRVSPDPEQTKLNFRNVIWGWYRDHSNDTIYTVAGFFKVKVKHLRKLFEQLAGYEREVPQ
jgi:hypothetical protein